MSECTRRARRCVHSQIDPGRFYCSRTVVGESIAGKNKPNRFHILLAPLRLERFCAFGIPMFADVAEYCGEHAEHDGACCTFLATSPLPDPRRAGKQAMPWYAKSSWIDSSFKVSVQSLSWGESEQVHDEGSHSSVSNSISNNAPVDTSLQLFGVHPTSLCLLPIARCLL